MAAIKTFRGYRYKLESHEELSFYTSPPYDMIDAAMVEKLYEKHPLNTVRIIQNKPEAVDRENRTRHERAAKILDSWIKEGILIRDSEDCVYVYNQNFVIDSEGRKCQKERTGVVVLVKLTGFEEKVVFPHEYTLSGPKQDRYELLETTRTNTGQVFGLVSDRGDIYEIIKRMKNESTLCGSFTDETGVCHSLYRCSDGELGEQLKKAVEPRSILIADGHHRYETALRFYRDKGNEQYSHMMMTLVSTADPGLVIRPFHRLIKMGSEGKQVVMKEALGEFFHCTDMGEARPESINGSLICEQGKGSIIYMDKSSRTLSSLRLNETGEKYLKSVMPEHTDLWKHLGVSIINAVVIKGILGLNPDGHVLHDRIDYVNTVEGGVEMLDKANDYYGGFFIEPVSIDTVNAVVEGGERMPQKSTNFFPKLFSGLVFNRMDPK